MSILIEPKEVVLTLAKSAGAQNQKAKVVLVIDRSVSIKELYDNGTVQRVIERVLPIGMGLDDDGKVDLYIFEDVVTKIKQPVSEGNYTDFVTRMIGDADYGGTKYYPAINAVLQGTGCNQDKQITYLKKKTGLMGLFGNKPKETKALIRVDSTGKNEIPTFCIFITDGDADDTERVKDLMFGYAPLYPVFFQFIGIKTGSTNYKFLRALDTMGEGMLDTTERFIDNANFIELTAEDLLTKTDAELYPMLLGEFLNKYIPTAKKQFLIK